MADRQLRVTLIGDSASLDRTLARTETKLAAFGRTATKTSGVFGKLDTKSLLSGAAGGAGFFAATAGAQLLGTALKEGVKDAASLQKSGEAIDAIFGKSAGGVKEFAHDAANLGISAVESEALSVRLGILTKNLGIGQEKAAEMAVGLQKLAGSIAEIRGINPATVIQNLPQALAGNLRSLKQLGFAFSQAQIKQEALREGILKTGQAITPAIKAQAIYALVTKNLAGFEDLAAQHSGDLANQQHKLHAQVTNLETSVGELATGPLTALFAALNQNVGAALKLVDAFKQLGGIKLPDFLGGGDLGGSDFAKGFKDSFKAQFAPLLALADALKGDKKPPPKEKPLIRNDSFGRDFGQQDPRDARVVGGIPRRPGPPVKQLSVALRNREADARLSGSSGGLLKVLADEASFLKSALQSKRLQPKDKLGLKEALLSVTTEVDSINTALKDAADSAKAQARASAAQAAAARKAAREAAAAQLKARAQNILSTALDRLNAQLNRVQADRQLEDARAALKVARQIGGPQGIKLAKRDVQDALLQEQIAKLDQAKVRSEGKGSFVVSIGTVELHGIQNAKQLLAELQRLSRTGSPQSRGARPGQHLGHA